MVQLIKSSFDRRSSRSIQSYSTIWHSLVFCLGVVSIATPNEAGAQELSQSKLVAMFETVCLKSKADPTAAARAAARLGLKQVSPHQFSDARTTLNVHLLTSDTSSARAKIELSKFADGGWDTVKLSVSKPAGFKGKGTGCALSAYNVPIERLAGAMAPVAAKYNGQMKVKSRGRVGQADITLSGEKARIITRPMNVTSKFTFAFLSVVRSR